MIIKKYIHSFLLVVLAFAILLSACGSSVDDDTQIAVIVALTQTAAAQTSSQESTSQTEEPTSSQLTEATATSTNTPQASSNPVVPPVVVASGYQPYDCAFLASTLNAKLGLTGAITSPVPFSAISGENGNGCQIFYSATMASYSGDMFNLVNSTFAEQGWVHDPSGDAGGPGAFQTTFRKDGSICISASQTEPVDRALCNPDEIFASCMDRLPPEQRAIKVTLTCSTYIP